jgi:hypothetical protein
LKNKTLVLVLVVGLCVLFAGVAALSVWDGGMTIGLMSNEDQFAIMSTRFVIGAPEGDTIRLTVQNSGSNIVAIVEGYVNGIKATNIGQEQAFLIPKMRERSSVEIPLIFPNGTLVYGAHYQVKLVTAKGTQIYNSLTYDSKNTSQYNPLNDVNPTPSAFHDNSYQQSNSLKMKWVFVSIVLASVADVGVCLLANHMFQPRSKGELFFLLFFFTMIVAGVTIFLVSNILFPPMTIG